MNEAPPRPRITILSSTRLHTLVGRRGGRLPSTPRTSLKARLSRGRGCNAPAGPRHYGRNTRKVNIEKDGALERGYRRCWSNLPFSPARRRVEDSAGIGRDRYDAHHGVRITRTRHIPQGGRTVGEIHHGAGMCTTKGDRRFIDESRRPNIASSRWSARLTSKTIEERNRTF